MRLMTNQEIVEQLRSMGAHDAAWAVEAMRDGRDHLTASDDPEQYDGSLAAIDETIMKIYTDAGGHIEQRPQAAVFSVSETLDVLDTVAGALIAAMNALAADSPAHRDAVAAFECYHALRHPH